MFDNYYGSYTTLLPLHHKTRPTTLHHKTCPVCDSKRVNIYYSSLLDKYICKKCMDKLLRVKGSENET